MRPPPAVPALPGLVLLTLAVLALLGGRDAPAAPAMERAAETAVCGSLPAGSTTWTAAGSPYVLCAGGVDVPAGAVLEVDASLGPVAVRAEGRGGLLVLGEARTKGTSAQRRVSLTGTPTSGDAGTWAGVFSRGTLTLADADVALGPVQAEGGSLDLARVTVDRAADTGLRASFARTTLRDVTVTRSGLGTGEARDPAARLDLLPGTTLGGGGAVDGLQGAGNGLDVVALGGTVAGPLTWTSPTAGTAVRALGMVANGLLVEGDVTVPAGSDVRLAVGRSPFGLSVKGGLDVGGGTVLASAQDRVGGAVLCPSSLVPRCEAEPRSGLLSALEGGPADRGVVLRGVTARGVTLDTRRADLTVEDSMLAHGSVRHRGRGSAAVRRTTLRAPTTELSVPGLDTDAGTVALEDVTVQGARGVGVRLGRTPGPVTLTRLTVTESGSTGLSVDGPVGEVAADGAGLRPVTATGVRLLRTGRALRGAPAARLQGVDVPVQPDGSLGITAAGGPLDAVALAGRTRGSWTWRTPTTGDTERPVGHLLVGDLVVEAPDVVTLPAGAVVKGATFDLRGGRLDATAGGARLLRLDDESVLPQTCFPAEGRTDCRGGGSAQRLKVGRSPDGATTGRLEAVDVVLRDLQVAARGEALSAPGLVSVTRGTWQHASLRSEGVPVVVRDSTFADSSAGGAGAYLDLGPPLVVEAADVTLTGSRIDPSRPLTDPRGCCFRTAARITVGPQRVELTGNTFTRGAVEVRGQRDVDGTLTAATSVAVRRNSFVEVPGTPEGGESAARPALSLLGVETTVGPGREVDGNTGRGSAADVIALSGVVRGGLPWISPRNDDEEHPLGHVVLAGRLDARRAGLVVRGGTVTLPKDVVVKLSSSTFPGNPAGLYLEGASLDGTAGGALFTDLLDDRDGTPFCAGAGPTDRPCSLRSGDGGWSGVEVGPDPDTGAVGTVELVGTRFRGGGLAYSRPAPSAPAPAPSATPGPVPPLPLPGAGPSASPSPSAAPEPAPLPVAPLSVTWTGGRLDQAVLSVQGGAARLRDLVVRREGRPDPLLCCGSAPPGVLLVDGSGSQLFDLDVDDALGSGVRLVRTDTEVDGLRVTRSGGPAFTPTLVEGGLVSTEGRVLARCVYASDNAVGLTLPGGSRVSDSDLPGQAPGDGGRTRPDLEPLSATVTATRVWWGQPGGPRQGQVGNPDRVVVEDSRATPTPGVQMRLSGSAVQPDGTLGPGELVVDLLADQDMETDRQPAVTLTGPDGLARPVAGAWTGPRTWQARYALDNRSARTGLNVVRAAQVRGCVPDASAVAAPVQEQRTVEVGAPPPTPSPAPSPTPSPTASPTASSAPTAARSALRLSTSATSVPVGAAVRLGVRLVREADGAPLAGRPVRLVAAPAGQAARTVARLTTDAAGAASASLKPDRSTVYTAVVDGPGGSSSPRRPVAVRRTLTATVSATALPRGRTVTVTGKAAPAVVGRTVTLQVLSGGTWRTAATVRTGSGGSYRATFRRTAAGRYSLRAVVAADSAYAAGTSPTRTVTYR